MKVLYLAHTLDSSSGWGRFSSEIITRVIKSGVSAAVLTEQASGFPNEQVVLGRSWKALPSALKVRTIIKKEKPDIVHSLEVNPYGISADLGSTGFNIKHLITATGAYSVRPLYQPSIAFLTQRAYSRANRVLCISQYIKDEINKKVSLPQSVVVTLGVDTNKFSGTRIYPSERFIVSVGNLCFRKGYHVSIAAFVEVAKKIHDIKYYIAGSLDKDTYTQCQEIIQQENIEGKVVFLGSVSDEKLKELYLSAELFLLTSVNEGMHFEGFGLVFLEAASAGLPVIGTTGNGINDAMENGINGLLVPQNDISATAAAITRILTDSALRDSFSKASLVFAQKNSWDSVVTKYLEIYNEVLHERT